MFQLQAAAIVTSAAAVQGPAGRSVFVDAHSTCRSAVLRFAAQELDAGTLRSRTAAVTILTFSWAAAAPTSCTGTTASHFCRVGLEPTTAPMLAALRSHYLSSASSSSSDNAERCEGAI